MLFPVSMGYVTTVPWWVVYYHSICTAYYRVIKIQHVMTCMQVHCERAPIHCCLERHWSLGQCGPFEQNAWPLTKCEAHWDSRFYGRQLRGWLGIASRVRTSACLLLVLSRSKLGVSAWIETPVSVPTTVFHELCSQRSKWKHFSHTHTPHTHTHTQTRTPHAQSLSSTNGLIIWACVCMPVCHECRSMMWNSGASTLVHMLAPWQVLVVLAPTGRGVHVRLSLLQQVTVWTLGTQLAWFRQLWGQSGLHRFESLLRWTLKNYSLYVYSIICIYVLVLV